MRKILKTAAALAFTLGAVTVVNATPAQAAGSIQGCPSGAVCIYPGAGWNGGNPSHRFYSYGPHNLSNVYGQHRIFNNQTGGATMRTCTGYDGVGCEGYLHAGVHFDRDLTPINSITLQP
ncbi:MAG: hypothetical protein ABIQ26_13490 [Streptosporangiaceae bacterium]